MTIVSFVPLMGPNAGLGRGHDRVRTTPLIPVVAILGLIAVSAVVLTAPACLSGHDLDRIGSREGDAVGLLRPFPQGNECGPVDRAAPRVMSGKSALSASTGFTG